jgi:hypothetical protein
MKQYASSMRIASATFILLCSLFNGSSVNASDSGRRATILQDVRALKVKNPRPFDRVYKPQKLLFRGHKRTVFSEFFSFESMTTAVQVLLWASNPIC